MPAIYICIEGTEGVGKTTQATKLYDYLINHCKTVLLTKEPGTPHLPITMKLREIMLSNEFDSQLTIKGREYINLAIRNIHAEKLIQPNINKYDYIIQDRGILSGLAYGEVCGNDYKILESSYLYAVDNNFYKLYNHVIYLSGNVKTSLEKATSSKKEFISGDAIENKGLTFMENVNNIMNIYSKQFNCIPINIDNKNIDQVFNEILTSLKL